MLKVGCFELQDKNHKREIVEPKSFRASPTVTVNYKKLNFKRGR
jgi:hypothetical protein